MPDNQPARPAPGPRTGLARRAAEPLAWWTVLLAGYLAMASGITLTEITVGALTAAACAAAAVAGHRVLFTADRARRTVPPVRLLPALAPLPAQITADTARIIVRGAPGGRWTDLAVAPGPADRAAATLLLSASPGAYVGAVDPEHGRLRVHRLARGPSPSERRLRRAGLVTGPAREAP
ncbi:hypothetical protein [Actinomadura sp. KC216]|uniref:hypothetical protein n=1 Tax=Actinomadura sp. KC216 TaxID=2530370 RepID=UPI00140443FE|nr:hypothetical protein [Actinomadura sp. KC216]